MKTRTLILALTLASLASFAQPGLPRISVNANHFITPDGKTIIFRGLDTSDPDKLSRDGHWNKDYFVTMKSWGANIVRFPVHPNAWRSQGVENYLKLLDQGIALAKEQNLYVIIDWHSIGNLREEKFQSEGYNTTKTETLDFWRRMAQRYKDNSTVAFFELFNEPTTYNGKLGECSWSQWKEIVEEMIKVIRDNGAKTVPLVAGFNWAYDLKPVATDPINAENIGYVSHPYPMKREKPWEDKWTADWGFVAAKYPVILTEIGFCGKEEKGAHVPVMSDESYGDAITKYCADKGISYTVWVFDPNWAPMLFLDWNYKLTRQGLYFKTALQKGH